jgi:hypothetical protein
MVAPVLSKRQKRSRDISLVHHIIKGSARKDTPILALNVEVDLAGIILEEQWLDRLE